MQEEWFYVAASRSRQSITVMISDKDLLRDSVARSVARQSAFELARKAQGSSSKGQTLKPSLRERDVASCRLPTSKAAAKYPKEGDHLEKLQVPKQCRPSICRNPVTSRSTALNQATTMASAGKTGSLLAEGVAELRAADSCLRGILTMAEREEFSAVANSDVASPQR